MEAGYCVLFPEQLRRLKVFLDAQKPVTKEDKVAVLFYTNNNLTPGDLPYKPLHARQMVVENGEGELRRTCHAMINALVYDTFQVLPGLPIFGILFVLEIESWRPDGLLKPLVTGYLYSYFPPSHSVIWGYLLQSARRAIYG